MAVLVRYFTDPGCSASWRAEPLLRTLMVEFGDSLSWTYVMGGLARDYGAGGPGVHRELLEEWLDAAEGRMPVDPRLWLEAPIASTYPACMAVKAAAEQAKDGGYGYLRALREGLLCFRRKLDTTEALIEEARGAGLDAQRFRVDLGSHAIVEAFGADLERTRAVPDEARVAGEVRGSDGGERLAFPSLAFEGADGEVRWAFGGDRYEDWRDAALAAGAEPAGGEPPDVLEALRRFPRMAGVELEAVCQLPEPRACAELWHLASEWKTRPVRVLTGYLWEPA